MKKLLLSIIALITLIAGVAIISISSTNYKDLYQEFASNAHISKSKLEITDATLVKFPTPTLRIKELKEEGKISLQNIKIGFSLFSIIQFKPKISSVHIEKAEIYSSSEDINFTTHDQFISELINKGGLPISAKIDELKFIESDNDIPITMTNLLFSGSKNQSVLSGNIGSVGIINGSFDNNSDQTLFNLKIQGEYFDVNIVESYQNGILKSGQAIAKTKNLSRIFSHFITDIDNFANHIASSEEVTAKFDILPTSNSINLSNISINSKSISGNGEIILSRDKNYFSVVKLDFDKIHLASIDKENIESKKKYLKYDSTKKIDFTKGNIQGKFSAKNVKISNDNSLKNLALEIVTSYGTTNIKEFTGSFDKGGDFKVIGTVTNNDFRGIFNGQVALSHYNLNDFSSFINSDIKKSENLEPFSLYSNIKLSSVDFSLQNFLLRTQNNAISGNISTKMIGHLMRKNANLKFLTANLDKDNIPMISESFAYIKNLTSDMKKEDYISKFSPIRKINSISNYNIVFDHMILNNKQYKNVNFNLKTNPGEISLEHLNIKNGDNWIDSSITLNSRGVRPEIDITIHDGNMGVDFLSPGSIMDLRKKALSDFDLEKIDVSFNAYLTKIYQNNFDLSRVEFSAKNKENLLNISKFDADLFGGRMQSSGSILLEPYTYNFVYALNSANLTKITDFLPRGLVNTGGVISASGMWSTNGNTLNEQLYNLYTKSNVIIKSITVSNFSIDNFVRKVSHLNYDSNYFRSDLKNALLTGRTNIEALKAGLELSKGVIKLSDINFKTRYTSGSGDAKLNIYDLNMDLVTTFSFFLNSSSDSRYAQQYGSVKMDVMANGSWLLPKKSSDTEELLEALSKRN